MSKILKRILSVLLAGFLLMIFFILFIGSCLYFSGDTRQRAREEFKQEVRENIPEMFPILVITPGEGNKKYKAQLVYKKDLEDFLKKNLKYTYLVSEGQDDYLNREISGKYPWQARFKVERLTNGKQLLEVVYQWDDDHANRGWYEATDREIFPKYYQCYFGPAIAFQALAKGFGRALILWAIVGVFAYIILKQFKKKRLQKSAE